MSMMYVQVSNARTYQDGLDEEPRLEEEPKKSAPVDYEEKMGPWPIDMPARVLPVNCGKCKKGKDGKVRRSGWGYWPFDLPLRVLPTKYCGTCEKD